MSDVFAPDMLPALVTALTIAVLGATLSIFVVLKRLAFIGQGVSHAAFGGVGVAMILGLHGATAAGQVGQLGVVLAFSVGAALAIAALTRSEKGRTDTAIGVVLSASMALGFVLFAINEAGHGHDVQAQTAQVEQDAHAGHDHDHDHAAHDDHGHAAQEPAQDAHAHSDEHHVIEEILFGNLLDADWGKAGAAISGTLLIVATVWALRRKLVFWAFDEPACDAYAVDSRRMTNTLLVLLALAVVISMQVVGVVLAAAVLVLPGAAALNVSSRLRVVLAWSLLVALLGASAGFVLGLGTGWPVGPTIVLVQSAMYLLSLGVKHAAPRLRSA